MVDKQKKNLNPKAQQYQELQKKKEIKRPIIRNCLKAFLVGGFICFIGQCIATFYMYFFDFTEQTVGNPTIATLIIVTMFLTGFRSEEHTSELQSHGQFVCLL